MKGSKYIAETLRGYGEDHVFFVEAILRDALFEMHSLGIKRVLAHSEKTAAYMADGYARASGRAGVCLVTSGPGATNTVTGIATAYMDSIPMVVITGQVVSPLIGTDAFQEVDTIGITRPCVKHNFLVKRVEDLAFLCDQVVLAGKETIQEVAGLNKQQDDTEHHGGDPAQLIHPHEAR